MPADAIVKNPIARRSIASASKVVSNVETSVNAEGARILN